MRRRLRRLRGSLKRKAFKHCVYCHRRFNRLAAEERGAAKRHCWHWTCPICRDCLRALAAECHLYH